MNRLIRLCAVAVISCFVVSDAALLVKTTAGQISIAGKGVSEKKLVTDSAAFDFGDSLFLTEDNQATIILEKNSRLLLKGPLSVVVTNDNSVIKITLGDGQVFLDHNTPHEYDRIQIVSRGYVFEPIGTAAAVRVSKNTLPTTAVLRGKMKMQAPTGESIVVEKGNYGSIDQNGNLVSYELAPNAIEWLRTWSNLPAETDVPQTEPVTSQAATSAAPVADVPAALVATDSMPSPAPDVVKKEAASQAAVTPVQDPSGASVKEESKQVPAVTAPAQTSQNVSAPEDKAVQETAQRTEKTSDEKSKDKGSKPIWEISAGTATVDNEQWTRVAVGVDVPVWKFGVFFDVEMFIDNDGKISDKGWNFDDDWGDALLRKIRYIRFGQEQDPLFIKFGGLSSVTLGYGFLVDRFTNMLHYPDQKLLGLQVNLNKISPIGISLQTLVADFKDFRDDGGVVAARLGFTPFMKSSVPVVNGITFAGSYAVDLNQYAPARQWDIEIPRSMRAYSYLRSLNVDSAEAVDSSRAFTGSDPLSDAERYTKEKNATDATDQYGIIGGDVGVPLISSSLLSLDLYGQAGIRDDFKHGWGIGVPGISLKVWKLWASVEYRHVEGRFTPGHFGMYYLDERLQRNPDIITKEQTLFDDNLNGVFGKLGFNIANVIVIDGAYQYMVGEDDDHKDQRFEAVASIGDLIVKKIPRLSKAEAYLHKSCIGSTDVGYDSISSTYEYDSFFEKTPHLYWGYRIGIGITEGASLIFDSRYGYKRDSNDRYKMIPDNNISMQTAITF